MVILYLVCLSFFTIVSLIFSILCFSGKDIILDDAYLKASEEERKSMDKDAYRLQSAIVFLFIFAVSLLNLLRSVLHFKIFTYIASVLGVIGIIYAIISHYSIKKKTK